MHLPACAIRSVPHPIESPIQSSPNRIDFEWTDLSIYGHSRIVIEREFFGVEFHIEILRFPSQIGRDGVFKSDPNRPAIQHLAVGKKRACITLRANFVLTPRPPAGHVWHPT